MTADEWRTAAVLAAVILALHVAGLLLLVSGPLAAGVGVTAYTLGLRHAFDADHIAAIDNTTRKLLADGHRSMSVGFYFSLGHSTVVFVAAALLAVGVRWLGGGLGSVIGPAVSGVFLIGIGLLNLVVLVGLVRSRTGEGAPTGLLSRVYGRAVRSVRRPWQMYPLGVLFGLGFDTATEIALLATAAGAVAGGLPFWAILCLPVLFAAGMTLLDTLDGALMSVAYGWAVTDRSRTRIYSITITALSVVVALGIGTVELIDLVWGVQVDLSLLGFVIAGLFAGAWAVATLVRRSGQAGAR